jgi:hypothetical protein
MELSGVLGTAIVSVIVGPIGAGALAFLFKESVRGWLGLRLQNEVNAHKQALDTLTERFKHDLQIEMIKVEVYTKSKFKVYPELFEKMQYAHGAVTRLWSLNFKADTSRYTEADIHSILEQKHVAEGERKDIIARFQANRDRGLEQFNKLMRSIELQEARSSRIEASNYLLLNELFLSTDVASLGKDVLDSLSKVWTIVHVSEQPGGHTSGLSEKWPEATKKANDSLSLLRDTMRSEITPV